MPSVSSIWPTSSWYELVTKILFHIMWPVTQLNYLTAWSLTQFYFTSQKSKTFWEGVVKLYSEPFGAEWIIDVMQ